MKKTVKDEIVGNGRLPKILKINEITGLRISVLFSSGHDRILDFEKIFHRLKVVKTSAEYKLLNPKEFAKVQLRNHTLSWDNIVIPVKLTNKTVLKLPYEIGADVLLKWSDTDYKREDLKIGKMLKDLRTKSGMTQDELAELSGTSRTYISRIENDKSDIELYTLEKIIKAGFNKKLQLQVV